MPRQRSTKRYYSENDLEVGVTRSQLKRLGRDRQLEYMTAWFVGMFEDPANMTPYNSQEGGYLYIWGGPYDADDELSGEFGGLVSDERIEEAAKLVQEDGIYDWAPGPEHPDRKSAEREMADDERPDDFDEPDDLAALIRRLENGAETEFGDEVELDRRRAVVARLDALRIVLEAAAPVHGGIGHNNPPPDDEAETRQVTELRRLESVIRAELGKPAPEAIVVAKSAFSLRAIAGWFGKKAEIAVDAFAKGLGDGLGKSAAVGVVGAAALVGTMIPGVGEVIHAVIDPIVSWLGHVVRPV